MSNWKKEYDNDVGPDDDYFIDWWAVTDGKRTFKCDTSEDADFLISVLKQPETEPVACRDCNGMGFMDGSGEKCGRCNGHGYTSPPKRKPLPMGKIVQFTYDIDEDRPATMAELFRFARAIEAAHGIKGEA